MDKGITNKIDKNDHNKSAQILMILSNYVKKEPGGVVLLPEYHTVKSVFDG